MEMAGGSLQAHFFPTSDQTSDFVIMADLANTSHGAGGLDSILKLVQLVFLVLCLVQLVFVLSSLVIQVQPPW